MYEILLTTAINVAATRNYEITSDICSLQRIYTYVVNFFAKKINIIIRVIFQQCCESVQQKSKFFISVYSACYSFLFYLTIPLRDCMISFK
jgi:hypothetical protein